MKMKFANAGPTFGAQENVQAADIAFTIHTNVESSFYDAKYPPKEWPNIVNSDQIITDINPGAINHAYITRDISGSASFIGSGPNNDIPLVAQAAGAVMVPLALSAVGSEVTNEDARQYSFGFNGNLASDLGEAMRIACDNLVEQSIIFGYEPLGLEPWINYPGIDVFTVTGTWETKTSEQIVSDINTALLSLWRNSRTLFMPTEIFLPLDSYAILTMKPMVIGTTGVAETILEYVSKKNVMTRLTGKELSFFPSRYLADAGVGGVKRMVVMDRSKDNQCFPWPMPYLLSQPIPTPLSAQWYAEQKFGSYHVRQKGSMAYVDGI